MLALQLLLALIAIVALAHLLVGRIPDWCFVFLPCIFFVPDLFYMNLQWGTVPDWIGALSTAFGVGFAVYAFKKWKSQLVASKQFEVAVDLMRHLTELEWKHFEVSGTLGDDRIRGLQALEEHQNELLRNWKVNESFFDDATNKQYVNALVKSSDVINSLKKDGPSIEQLREMFLAIGEAQMSLISFMKA